MIKPYIASFIQAKVDSGIGKIKKNLQHHLHLIDKFMPGIEQTYCMPLDLKCKLLCLSESFLGGFGPLRYRTYKTNKKLAVYIPGKETDALGEKCSQYGFYLSGSLFEVDDEYPKHLFHTGFIINPNGKVILKYRKVSPPSPIEICSSPHVLMDRYGKDPDKIFPVARTEIGNLGIFICYDGMFPEIPRCLALNGAEILIHPWCSYTGTVDAVEFWRMRNKLRAFENSVYLIAVNWASSPKAIEYPCPIGHSMIVDFRGKILVELYGGIEWFGGAVIDIEKLREARCKNSFLPRLRMELFLEAYKRRRCAIANRFLNRNCQSQDESAIAFQEAVNGLIKQGVYEKPSE
jgi:predicted amidohydrolase